MAKYQEIIATPTSNKEHRDYLSEIAHFTQRTTKKLMAEREAEIEAGLVHDTPAMIEHKSKGYL